MSHSTCRRFDHIVILSGAGLSAESGVATFRDPEGIWQQYDPMDLATPEGFARNPSLVYEFYNARRKQLDDVAPNAAHRALARLCREYQGRVFLVTQNVDDLLEQAGCSEVCHMHGELRVALCTHCGERSIAATAFDGDSHCVHCGEVGGLRPDIVWFGETPYHMAAIERELSTADLFVAIGTSGTVYPAAGFVQEARWCGAHTLEINLESSERADVFDEHRLGPATEQVKQWVEEMLAGQ
ncbi:NAD-dependent protein deacylase (plasmid) [Halioglobus japonicus]|uniref:NAD-dependent protein deacylase n=1 Tax=Halioglobus japonicus TaxID=930805 RepID=A0AAP8SQ07_9GAMM|nr:NAD-dependent deacylase [Halioglobus japonicus]AQA18923.1 NAD-dependent protein deacylase [Halioglobus japonicus]AQA20396.1 NAD-dependent protein deacylase [Halioglobus japonicus]PLW88064.1 NAD-dependent deacylase [Halioglobus japonicus]GHD20650.1 NAD-dependent protein deacylase [Halioglobus japonicus]